MFIQFFYTNYIKQARSPSPPSTSENVRRSGKEATKDLRQELEDAMSSEHDGLETDKADIPSQIADQSERMNKAAENFSKKAKSAASNAADRVKDGAQQANDIFQEKGQQATDAISDKVNEMNKKAKDSQQTETNDRGAYKAVKNEPEQNSKPSNEDTPKQDMGKAPKLEPTSSSKDGSKKPKSRSVSPQKKTQLPRPQSRNRQQSPERKDQWPTGGDKSSTEQNKAQTNGATPSKGDSKGGRKDDASGGEEKPSSLDESAYEVNPDELENEEEKKAEAKMQPKSS